MNYFSADRCIFLRDDFLAAQVLVFREDFCQGW